MCTKILKVNLKAAIKKASPYEFCADSVNCITWSSCLIHVSKFSNALLHSNASNSQRLLSNFHRISLFSNKSEFVLRSHTLLFTLQ